MRFVSRDPLLYLEDILSSCEKILSYCSGLEYDGFIQDSRTYDAVIRNLEIIGEATHKLPTEIPQKYPRVEWRSIRAFRNIVAHEYFRISNDILWDIITNKIPVLKIQIAGIIQDLNKSN